MTHYDGLLPTPGPLAGPTAGKTLKGKHHPVCFGTLWVKLSPPSRPYSRRTWTPGPVCVWPLPGREF
jgi:hypothetical protein